MNKTIYKIALVIALTMAASSAYSASTSLSGTVDVGGNSFSASNKVFIGVQTDAGVGSFNGTTYVVTAVHGSGDKLLSSTSGDAKLYWKTTSVGQTTAVAPGGSSKTDWSGWTSM